MVRVIVCGHMVFTVPSSSRGGNRYHAMEEGVDAQPDAAEAARLSFWRILLRSLTATFSIVMCVWLFVMRYLYKDPECQHASTEAPTSTWILCLLVSLAPTLFIYMVTREDEATYT
ncbi:unnamed protein product [Alopecurus aequalis]